MHLIVVDGILHQINNDWELLNRLMSSSLISNYRIVNICNKKLGERSYTHQIIFSLLKQ